MQKPDPEILRRTISAANGKPETTVMIGDSITDIRTARSVGVPVIAADFGYNERPIAEFGPDRIISHFAELPVAVAAISSGFWHRYRIMVKCGKVNGVQYVAPAWVRPYPCDGRAT